MSIALALSLVVACGEDAGVSDGPQAEGAEERGGERSADSGEGSVGERDASESPDDALTDPAPPPGVVSYHGAIRGLLEDNCTSCHVSGGGAPFPLTHDPSEWDNGTPWWATSVVNSVSEGTMPPWLPEQDCRPILHERVLSADEIATFEAWQAQGFPLGDEADYVASEASTPVITSEADIRLDAGEDYVADPSSPDDYRCFVVGDAFEVDTFIKAVDVKADQTSIVHHVLVYAIPPEQVDILDAKEANDPGLGYSCFGGTGISGAETVYAWAPGSVPFVMPEGAAMLLPAGSKIVLQLHYNLAYLDADAPVPADRSEALLWTMPADEAPDSLIRILPYAHLGIDIEAGSPYEEEEKVFDIPFTATAIGVLPHMHVLGRTIQAEHLSEDGDATCMVEIGDWDFNWQQIYLYDPQDHIQLKGGDQLRLNCTYDNSPENQPVVNGQQVEPRQVGWGDGTFDEMCLTYVIVKTPFEIDGGICAGVATCSAACPEGDFDCFLGCALVPGANCLACIGQPFIECGAVHCQPETAAAMSCFNNSCGDDRLKCIRETCTEEFNTLHACLGPKMHEGACNSEFESCELSF